MMFEVRSEIMRLSNCPQKRAIPSQIVVETKIPMLSASLVFLSNEKESQWQDFILIPENDTKKYSQKRGGVTRQVF